MSPVVNIPGLNHAFEITKSGMITRVFKRRPIDAQHVDVGDTRGMMCKFWRVGISKRKLRQERFIMVYSCWFCRLHFCNFWSLVACVAIVEWPLTLMIFSAVSPFQLPQVLVDTITTWLSKQCPAREFWTPSLAKLRYLGFHGGSKDEKKSREDDLYVVNPCKSNALYKPLHPTRTLLHTYNRHDHHDHHQSCWLGNNINFIFMRDQNSPPPLNNMLIGVITSTISPWGIKIRTPSWTICWLGEKHQLYLHEGSKFEPYEQYVDWGNNINFIFMRDQNSPPPMNNMLIGVIASTLSSWGIKIRHPLWTICWLG